MGCTEREYPEPRMGETRQFEEVIYINAVRYEFGGDIKYCGNGQYDIKSDGWSEDGHWYMIVCGRTQGDTSYGTIIISVSNGYGSMGVDRDYDRKIERWFYDAGM